MNTLLAKVRAAGLTSLAVGAAGSIALELYHGSRAPGFLLVAFALWVTSPFAALAIGDRLSAGWSPAARISLYGVMMAMAAGTLIIYSFIAFGPHRPQGAFAFVVVPPASWVLSILLVPLGALIARRMS